MLNKSQTMKISHQISIIYSEICNCTSLIPHTGNQISKYQTPLTKTECVSRSNNAIITTP